MDEATKKMVKSPQDEAAVEEGCYYDPEAAAYVQEFFESFLRHTKGQWSGKPFELLDWEKEINDALFGWKREDGTRRYRQAYVEVPKKNGKSSYAAGLAAYMLHADGEPGAEVYSAAYDRSQASIVYREASQMIRASSGLEKRTKLLDARKRMVVPATNSFYQALSRDAHAAEGINVHCLIFDELHVQKTPDLWDALRYGGAARSQPLLMMITTAGVRQESIGYEQHKYAQQIIDGTIIDTSFFAKIYAADKDDDWTDPEVWKKANPSFGITINEEDFAHECQEAQASPRKENNFRRYRLNQWTEQAERWLSLDKWDACDDEPIDFKGYDVYGGLDLASTTDVASLALGVEHGGEWSVRNWYWIPEDNAAEREHRDGVPYLQWAREGYIELTPGNSIDYGAIQRKILELDSMYGIRELGFDPWNSTQFCQELAEQHGMSMVQVRQGYVSLNEPTKKLEGLVVSGRLRHGGNPVTRWMAGNVTVKEDPAGNLKPDKGKSTEKIDGIAAIVTMLNRGMFNEGGSVYTSERGILTI